MDYNYRLGWVMIVVELCVFGIFFVRKVNLLIIYIDYINCVNKLVYIEKVVIICCVLFFLII